MRILGHPGNLVLWEGLPSQGVGLGAPRASGSMWSPEPPLTFPSACSGPDMQEGRDRGSHLYGEFASVAQ